MKPSPVRIPVGLLFLLTTTGLAATVEEKYDDGKPKLKYAVDDKGRKEGIYQEYYASGKTKLMANYKNDQRQGTCTEFDEKGKKILTALYKEGKLSGTLIRYENGLPILYQPFKDGEPVFPKSREKIAETLQQLLGKSSVDGPENARDQALRRLKAYRFLCDVPYQDLKLDDECNRQCQAAAKICEMLKRLDHSPPNPGLAKAEYKLAFDGARRSNLGAGMSLVGSVDMWMYDSNPGNIEILGHRRWCLNPGMAKTGFGESGRFTAMYSNDNSRQKVPDYNFISYPPRGLMPVMNPAGRFSDVNTFAWCFCPHPRKFMAPGDGVKAKVTAIDEQFRKMGEPLKLNFHKVDKMPLGQLGYCVIFRPENVQVADGRRYLVEIEGLKLMTGRLAGTVAYPVVFFELK